MAKATIQSIKQLSDKLHNRWMREFAGKPRHTRDLGELEKLIEKAAALAHKSKGIPGDKGDQLEKVVVERWKLYHAERDAIAEAQYDRPEVAEIHALGLKVDRALAQWRRHFAGRDRRTRDLVRLEQVIQTLATSVPRLEALAEHPEVKKQSLEGLRGQLEVLRDERGEIDKLRRGLDASARPTYLLAEAQSALDQFRVHFLRQPRATCSPARLERIIGQLAHALDELELLAENNPADDRVIGDAQAKNLETLTQNLTAWRAELPQLRAAHEAVSPRDLTSHLGAVANQLSAVYQREFAGQARATRNLTLLSDLCDRMTEIAEMMAAHDAASGGETLNRKNLATVDARVRSYEAEWVEIAKAKAQAAQNAQSASTPGGAAQKAPAKPQLPGITIAKKA